MIFGSFGIPRCSPVSSIVPVDAIIPVCAIGCCCGVVGCWRYACTWSAASNHRNDHAKVFTNVIPVLVYKELPVVYGVAIERTK